MIKPVDIRKTLTLLEEINILNEVSMAKYTPGKRFIISDSAEGKKAKAGLASQNIDVGEGYVTYVDIKKLKPSQINATIGSSKSISYAFATDSGQIWVYNGATPPLNHLRSTDTELKLTSAGETAEGILGAAMFAKFIKRESRERIGDVTPADVIDVLDKIHASGGKVYTVTVPDSDGGTSDTVSFYLSLKTTAYNDLMNPEMRPLLAKHISSAVGYVNSELAEEYSRYFYLNNSHDDIAIIAAGPEGEKSTKVDVRLVVRGKDGKVKNTKLNTSLKIGGIEQFGQVYGTNAETIVDLYKYFGADISSYVSQFNRMKESDRIAAIGYLYGCAQKEMTAKLNKETTGQAERFVDSIAQGIIHFATLGNPDVELVDFDKGGFKILRFDNLQTKLRNVSLIVKCPPGKKQPVLVICDKNDESKKLIQVRCKIENVTTSPSYPDGLRVRHYVEKGKFLEELTRVEPVKKEISLADIAKDTETAVAKIATKHVDIRPPGTARAPRAELSQPREKRK
jgi:hypothetical protein